MSTARRDRALLAIVAAGGLGAAATSGTLALWTTTAGGEGSIEVVRYTDSVDGLAESASDGAAETPSDGPEESPGTVATESATGSAVTSDAGTAEMPSGDSSGPTIDDTSGTTRGAPSIAQDEPAPVRAALPQELIDQVNEHGRGAAVLEHDLERDDIESIALTLSLENPDLELRLQAYTVAAPQDCSVTDVELPDHDGTPVDLAPGAPAYFCLELEAATRERSGAVTATGHSEHGDVAAREDWEVTVHDTLTTDDIEVVLTPVIEVTP